eukprot:13776356-Alexandrium_andersonii.AAC.1
MARCHGVTRSAKKTFARGPPCASERARRRGAPGPPATARRMATASVKPAKAARIPTGKPDASSR